MIWTLIEAAATCFITASVFFYGSRSRPGRVWAGCFGFCGAVLWALIGAHAELYLLMGMNILFIGLYTRNVAREVL